MSRVSIFNSLMNSLAETFDHCILHCFRVTQRDSLSSGNMPKLPWRLVSQLLLEQIETGKINSSLMRAILQTSDFIISLQGHYSTGMGSQRRRYWDALCTAATINTRCYYVSFMSVDTYEEQNLGWGEKELLGAALIAAACMNDLNLTQKLLQMGADIDTENDYFGNPLFIAVANCVEESTRLLLDNNAKVLVDWSSGQTALHEAAINGMTSLLQLLVHRPNRRTPLSPGVDMEYLPTSLPIAGGQDFETDRRGGFGRTPLACAAKHGRKEVVKFLLGRDDVVAGKADFHGRTPLVHAVREGHASIVKMLLDRDDVNPNYRDKSGLPPLYHALYQGHDEIAELLLKRDDNFVSRMKYPPSDLFTGVSERIKKCLMEEYKNLTGLDINLN